jgi:hypothetical protein
MDYMMDTSLEWALAMEEVKHTVLWGAVKLVEHIQAMEMIICPVGLISEVVLIHLCIQAAAWVVDTYPAVARDLIIKF